MFLLAIKGLHVQPDAKMNTDNCIKLGKEEFYLGIFSSCGDLYLEDEDVRRAVHMFKTLT